MTLTVADAAAVFQVIAGHDPRDATSATEPVPDTDTHFPGDPNGARIGVPRGMLTDGVDSAVLRAFDEALAALTDRGATLREIDLPHMAYAVPVYYLVAPAEASSNLARYDGVRYGFRAALQDDEGDLSAMYDQTRHQGFGPEVKRRIMLGTYALSAGYYDAYYVKAQRVRSLIRRDYDQAFAQVDAVAMPTTPLGRVPNRRTDRRPAGHVSGRHLHGQRQSHRAAGDQPAVWLHRGRSADRLSAHRATIRRGDPVRPGRCL